MEQLGDRVQGQPGEGTDDGAVDADELQVGSEQQLEPLGRLLAVPPGDGRAHQLADLAVDGTDLIGIGYLPGPDLGRALSSLLAEVVTDPTLNRRDALLARAEELLRA